MKNSNLKIDTYSILARQTITGMRGRRSARQLSKMLGASENQVGRWESGESALLWIDFVDLCDELNIPLQKIMNRIFLYDKNPRDLSSLFHLLSGTDRPELLAQHWDVSQATISRWLSGGRGPSLEKVFFIIELVRRPLEDLIESLVPHEMRSPDIEDYLHQRKKTKSPILKKPWALAISVIAITSPFAEIENLETLAQHIAQRIGIPKNEIQSCLNEMIEVNVIKWSSIEKKYVPENTGQINIPSQSKEYADSASFWTLYADEHLRRLSDPKNKVNKCGYLALSCSEEGLLKVRNLISDFYADLCRIVSEDHGQYEFPCIININMTNLLDLSFGEFQKKFEKSTNKVNR